jgi:hypothetical protein
MRKFIFPLLMLLSLSALAAEEQVRPGETIELKDGGKVTVQKDGTMVHVDAAGKRVKMRDNVVMEAKDGTKYVMKNNAIWKTITEKGTLNPKF